jgi:N-methylhydantoinase A/acetophenone carboxylase
MRNAIAVDVGGTFTDCYVVHEGRTATGKASTTRHKLEVGFGQAVQQCAELLGLTRGELLSQCDMIRYGTTLAMNALIERRGPKLGLITTAGFEDIAHVGRGAQWHDGLPVEMKRLTPRASRPEPIIPRDMIVGLREKIDAKGRIHVPLGRTEVEEKVQRLVDEGALGFVVCLINAFSNPVHEELVQAIIREIYPQVYLGSQPIILSSQVAPKLGEYARTMTSILSAYLQRSMAEELVSLGVELREQGYRRYLFLVNNRGGSAPLQKTTAVETYNAGPVAGLIGASRLAARYGFKNVVATDMGGTSFDIGLFVQAEEGASILPGLPYRHFYTSVPLIDRFRVGISMIETKSIGAGGGSIASFLPERNVLKVGPKSAGSMPGPACYDMGGQEPTVTDADLVLGYLDPQYFLDGNMPLNIDRARQAIDEKVGRPLGFSTEEAAWAIRRLVDADMGNEIFKETTLRGYDPREFTLFAYGGAGPTHCCGYAESMGALRVVTFRFASVFSAFGIADMDFVRVYEQSGKLQLLNPGTGTYMDDPMPFNEIVAALRDQALKDGRDFESLKMTLALEVDMRYGAQPNVTRVKAPQLFLENADQVKELCKAFEYEYGRMYSPASSYPQGGVDVIHFVLWSIIETERLRPREHPLAGPDPSGAVKGQRLAFWKELDGYTETQIYDEPKLQCGNMVTGPAVLEAPHTTYVVPPGWCYKVDQYLNGIFERSQEG